MKIRTVNPYLVGLVLVAASTLAHGQNIVLRCGGAQGENSIETDGYFINSQGEVVFNEESILCGPSGSLPGPGSELPGPLAAQFSQPPAGGPITQLPANIPFTAQVSNYDYQSVFFNDLCKVKTSGPAPGTATVQELTLQPASGTGLATGSLSFPVGLANGNYQVALACSRHFQDGQQQAVVSNPALRTVNVNVPGDGGGPTPPSGCDNVPIDPIFSPINQRSFTDAYVGGDAGGGWREDHQTEFDAGKITGWLDWPMQVVRDANDNPLSLRLRVWAFQPTENARVQFQVHTQSANPVALSISECPGQFGAELGNCVQGGSLDWATGSRVHPASCNLEAGKTYYINHALFHPQTYHNTGTFVSSTCTTCRTTIRNRPQ